MTESVDPHAPSPEFRAHLQWQIETALRRESRLAAPVRGGVRRLRTAIAVAVALVVGGAAGVASGHVQDARQRSSLIDSVQAEMELTQTRLALAQAEYRDAKERYEIGQAGRDSVRAAEQQVRAMEAAVERLRLDLQEIQATASAPRNDLDAPLVEARDFVRDRLMLELRTAERRLAAAEEVVADMKSRMEIGTVPRASVSEAQADVARVRGELALLKSKLDLRQQYLGGQLAREQLAATLRRTELMLTLQRVREAIELARERFNELRRQASVGVAAELEVKRAEVDLLEREVELQRIQRELAALSSRAK
jgi:hypothetical protein